MPRHLAALLSAVFFTAAAMPASAANFVDTVVIPTSSIRCGYFVTRQDCYGSVALSAPRDGRAGDTFRINATFEDRFFVPASPGYRFVQVGIFDDTAVLGNPDGGDIYSRFQLQLVGYEGSGEPLQGIAEAPGRSGYGAVAGFPDGGEGFSVSGAVAQIVALTDNPRPLIGISAGYSVELPAVPVTIADLLGGSPDAPVILPSGLVGQIRGNIGEPYGTDAFYAFDWAGGLFQVDAAINGAAADAAYQFKLGQRSSDGATAFLPGVILDGDNDFSGVLTYDLAPGAYTIGLATGTATDPSFAINFRTPVGTAAVPEPATWMTMILGFAAVGGALRRRAPKRQGARLLKR